MSVYVVLHACMTQTMVVEKQGGPMNCYLYHRNRFLQRGRAARCGKHNKADNELLSREFRSWWNAIADKTNFYKDTLVHIVADY